MHDLGLAKTYRRHGFGLGGVLLKQSLYPGDLLERLLDGAELVLDFGCGEGLLTNLLAHSLPRARFIGIDVDAAKIAPATSCRTSARTEFHRGSLFDHETNGADAVIFNDVLHHLSTDDQVRALEADGTCRQNRWTNILPVTRLRRTAAPSTRRNSSFETPR